MMHMASPLRQTGSSRTYGRIHTNAATLTMYERLDDTRKDHNQDRLSCQKETSCPLPGIPNALIEFRQQYDAREPRLPVPVLAHESRLLDKESGFRLLGYAPAQDVDYGAPPKSRRDKGHHRYLWVIDEKGVPFIKEVPIESLGLQSAMPKHTNLTGGRPAYAGGELWFQTTESLFVSGGSGRYEPIHPEQLDDAVGVFEAYGYTVTSLGWDVLRNSPRRLL